MQKLYFSLPHFYFSMYHKKDITIFLFKKIQINGSTSLFFCQSFCSYIISNRNLILKPAFLFPIPQKNLQFQIFGSIMSQIVFNSYNYKPFRGCQNGT